MPEHDRVLKEQQLVTTVREGSNRADSSWTPRRLGLALRRAPLWGEVGLIVGFYVGYALVQGAGPHNVAAAHANGWAIWGLEQHLAFAPERWLNQLAIHHSLLAQLSGWFYGTLHFTLTPAVLVWLYFRRGHTYGRWRTTLAVSSLVALAVYWIYPVAPPRLLTSAGLQDVLVAHNILSAANPHGPSAFVNLYAAMPSLHVAWATWCALAVSASLPGHRTVARLVWLYPLTTCLVVLVTANHYVADAVAGAVLVLVVDRMISPQRLRWSRRTTSD